MAKQKSSPNGRGTNISIYIYGDTQKDIAKTVKRRSARAGFEISRSEVIRLALVAGLKELASEDGYLAKLGLKK